MKTKKILSLLLSVVSLNLSANFLHCFGMMSDDDSIIELTLPGYTNCPMPGCGAQRPSKTTAGNVSYSTMCPYCGSRSNGLVKRKTRNKQYINKTSNIYACKFCGSQRKKCTRREANSERRKSAYQCPNCLKCGTESSFCIPYANQTWKKTFCDCESCSGLIVDFRTLIRRDAVTNQKIPKVQTIKSIICDPNGFDYYCYNCQKLKHITLTKKQAEHVCSEYDSSL